MKKLMHLILTVYLIGIMAISSFASELYVYDEGGLLEAEELVNLNAKAEAVSEKYGYGVYIIAVNDYQDYSNGDAYIAATEMYHGLGLGKGENREGILLMLSMEDRDYATFFYGENVEYAFDEYGQIQIEEQFLDDFAENQWYEGFDDYVSVCDEYLGLAAAGTPVRESHAYMFVIVVAGSLLIALVVVFILKSSMKSVYKGSVANAYVTAEGLNLTQRSDFFLYNTQTRRKIESSSSNSGSSSRSGGGGSGRTGKF